MNETDYLAHHGILGQKWGVRRYQNYDGSLTSLGRKRRGYSSDSVGKKIKSAANDLKKSHQARKEQKAKELEVTKRKARKEEAERQAKKAIQDEENLKRRLREHPEDIYKNRDKLSREDIDKIMKDIEWDRKCADIRREEYQRGLRKVKDLNDTLQTASNLMNTGINAYNNAALIYNAMADAQGLSSKKMKQVKWDNNNNNNKNNSDNDNN